MDIHVLCASYARVDSEGLLRQDLLVWSQPKDSSILTAPNDYEYDKSRACCKNSESMLYLDSGDLNYRHRSLHIKKR